MNQIYTLVTEQDNNKNIYYILGKVCICVDNKNNINHYNGYEVEDMFKTYKTKPKHQQKILKYLDAYNMWEGFDCEQLSELCYNDQVNNRYNINYVFTQLTLYYRTPELIKNMLKHDNPNLRAAVVKHCNKKHMNELVSDCSELVRCEVAKYGDDDIKYKLLDDESNAVRVTLAKYGDTKCLDTLVNDEMDVVRLAVAKTHRLKYLNMLITDSSEWVREEIARRGYIEHLDVLVHDYNVNVRRAVAKHKIAKHENILGKDKEWIVQYEYFY